LDAPLEYDPVLRATFPMRNTFTFSSGIRITSEFEAGNLWKCQEIAPEAVNDVEPALDEDLEIDFEEVKFQTSTSEDKGTSQSDANSQYSLFDTQTLF